MQKRPLIIILSCIAVVAVAIIVVSGSGGSSNPSGVHEADPPVIVGGPNSTVGPATGEAEEASSDESEHEREERQFAEEYAECPPTNGIEEVCETRMEREAENP